MKNTIMWQEIAPRFTEAVLHVMWSGSLLAAIIFVIDRSSVRTAAERHRLYLVGLLLMTFSLPACFILSGAERPQLGGGMPAVGKMASPPILESIAGEQTGLSPSGQAAGSGIAPGSSGLDERRVEDMGTPGWLKRSAPWVMATHLSGLVVMLARLWFGWIGTGILRRGAEPVSASIWAEAMQRMGTTLGLKTLPLLAWSRDVASAVLIGLARPAVLLPVAIATRLTPGQLEAVVAHELAHLRRRDSWGVALQRAIETVLFFHPAAWWMSLRLEQYREEACDDLVLQMGWNPADYAEALLCCSEMRLRDANRTARFAIRLPATGRGNAPLRGRIMRVLGHGDPKPAGPGRPGWFLAAAALAGILLATTHPGAEEPPAPGPSRETGGLPTSPADKVAGNTLRKAALQGIVDEEYARGLTEYRAVAGTVILMDPKTGEVLAMTGRAGPGTDPPPGISREQFHPAIHSAYEPGSTFKVVGVSGALDEGLVKNDTSIFCHHGALVEDRLRIPDHHPYGHLTVQQIVQKSSNIGTYKISKMLGHERFIAHARQLGFTRPTGINLPGEASGTMTDAINRVNFSRMSYGYGLRVTPIQVANAYCAIANGGLLMRPRVLDQASGGQGKPEVLRRIMTAETARIMREMLATACSDEGTARQAQVEGYQVAGKTGTSLKVKPGVNGFHRARYTTSFVGMLPAEHPQFVCLVLIDDPQAQTIKRFGGTVAAPIFSKIATRVAKAMDIPLQPTK